MINLGNDNRPTKDLLVALVVASFITIVVRESTNLKLHDYWDLISAFVFALSLGSALSVNLMWYPALSLFLLRELPFSRFNFPRWQSVLAITLIGALAGLDPALRAGTSAMPSMPLWVTVPFMVLMVWVAFLVILAVLRWWLKRGQRWDGQGNLFNLVTASWLIADTLGAGLTALGVPPLLTLPLWLYSVWVGAHALSAAIPKASLGYSLGGIVIGLVPAMLASFVLFAMLGIVLAMLGLVPTPGAGPEGMG